MRRVLNSGTIKLPYFKGSEKEIIDSFKESITLSNEEIVQCLIDNNPTVFGRINFTFEIKSPLLVFNLIQKTQLGVLRFLPMSEHQEAYLPSQLYKQDAASFIPMDANSCNEYNTKLNNFYNWSFNFYKKLLDAGVCTSQAELVLPQGLFVNFLWELSAEDLIIFIESSYNKSPELYGYCSTLSLYLEDHLPLVTSWLKKNKWKDLF